MSEQGAEDIFENIFEDQKRNPPPHSGTTVSATEMLRHEAGFSTAVTYTKEVHRSCVDWPSGLGPRQTSAAREWDLLFALSFIGPRLQEFGARESFTVRSVPRSPTEMPARAVQLVATLRQDQFGDTEILVTTTEEER